MTFLEALYGSQYREISQRGKDGAKGRLNGNIFLTAMIILLVLVITGIALKTYHSFHLNLNGVVQDTFGSYRDSGKNAGKLLVIPLFAICYFIISGTVGSKSSYEKITERFNLLPEDLQKKANKKVLVPFFILLGLLIIIVMFK